jgi:hypothetical protein
LVEKLANFSSNSSVILSPYPIKRNSTINIGIIIIVGNSTNIDEYEYAIESIKCYAEIHQYPLEIIRDDQWSNECPQKDV